MKTITLLALFLGAMMAGPAAMAQDDFEIQMPERIKKIPHVYVTADELANPDLYHPHYENAYNPPPASMLPPPPATAVTRPGEFEPMDSVIITAINYGGAFLQMWVDMMEAYTEAGHVYVIMESDVETYLVSQFEGQGIDASSYTVLNAAGGYPVDSIWIRDYGPEFAREEDGTRHIFDAYYYGRPLDDAIPAAMGASDWINADGSAMPVHEVDHMLSGGNIFTDGQGTCFCSNILYGSEEKPSSWTDQDVDDMMRDYLGCEQMIIFTPICHDATGHIDLYAKGMGRSSILLGEFPADTHFTGDTASGYMGGHCANSQYPNDYQDQEDNLAILESTTNLDGEPWVVTRMPMLEPFDDPPYGWVYRSYMNSQIFNGVVAMPSYYDLQGSETAEYLLEKEAEAIAAYEAASPNEVTVYPIDSDHIITWAGAMHCITHEIPAEFDYEYTEPGDSDTDADSDSDTDGDGGADDNGGSSDDGCDCSTTGSTSSVSLFSLLFI